MLHFYFLLPCHLNRCFLFFTPQKLPLTSKRRFQFSFVLSFPVSSYFHVRSVPAYKYKTLINNLTFISLSFPYYQSNQSFLFTILFLPTTSIFAYFHFFSIKQNNQLFPLSPTFSDSRSIFSSKPFRF